jgi:hypothetical protein
VLLKCIYKMIKKSIHPNTLIFFQKTRCYVDHLRTPPKAAIRAEVDMSYVSTYNAEWIARLMRKIPH